MRQIKRIPNDKEYDFGIGIHDQFGLRKKAGGFVTAGEVVRYGIGEKFLEPIGTEKKNWEDEVPENANKVVFIIEIVIDGEGEEKERMIGQFKEEFKNHIRQKGTAILRVIDIGVVRKRK